MFRFRNHPPKFLLAFVAFASTFIALAAQAADPAADKAAFEKQAAAAKEAAKRQIAEPGQKVPVEVRRDDQTLTLTVTLSRRAKRSK